MKKLLTAIVFSLGLLGGTQLYSHGDEHGGGKHVELSGEVLDLACYLSEGAKGLKHRKCAIDCAKLGVPIGLLDKKGEVYLIIFHSGDGKKKYEALGKKVGQTTTVEGLLVSRSGMKAIIVGSNRKAG